MSAPDVALAEIQTAGDDTPDDYVVLRSLSYAYPGAKQVLSDMNLRLPPGSRCLMTGPNAAGKTTLLHLLAGKAMVNGEAVRVLGTSPFHDTQLTVGGDLSYLGTQWRRTISCAGSNVALQGDFPAGKMIFGVPGIDPERREKLIRLLDIDCSWSMMEVSDGQRRRVQICLGLLRPFKVLLCDEITVDLDVVGRLDLLAFLKQECEQRGAVVVYATHIFDGMEPWLSHLAYVEGGTLMRSGLADDVLPADCRPGPNGERPKRKMLGVMEEWLRAEYDARQKQKAADALKPKAAAAATGVVTPFGLSANSKHMSYYR